MKPGNCIVFLAPGFPANESDSTCIPALQAFALQMKTDHPELHIKILTFQYPYKKGWYKWNGMDVYAAGGKNKKLFLKFFTWLKIISGLISIHRKEKIVLIHSFWLSECAFIGQLFTVLYRIKHISNSMGRDVLPENRYLKLLNKKKLIVVANSEFSEKKYFKAVGKHANHIIPFGLDTDQFEIKNEDNNRTVDVIGVGSLIPLKNYSLFIDIIRQLKNTFPTIQAQIAGTGPEFEKLNNLIITSGLKNNILLKGELPRQEIIRLMYQSKILLHTSLFESAGYVFLEALWCGLNVVSFQTGFQPVSDKMHICKTHEEMILKVTHILKNTVGFKREEIKTMKETVSEFYEVYKQEIF